MTQTAPLRRRDMRPAAAPRWRMPWGTAILAAVAFAGLLLLMYPTVASWWSQYNQSQLIVKVDSEVGGSAADTREKALDQARAYNKALVGGALLGAGSRVPTSSAGAPGFDYPSLLRADADGVMARLRVPSIGVDLPIYHGTSDATLTKGVGHLEGTSLPIGGADQHSVLTAHRGLAGATLFDNLDQVKIGDTFTVEVFGQVLTYRVRDTQVVLPEDTQTLSPQAGEDLVTLVTCTPLGINSHRILVTGERVTPTPQKDLDAAGATPDIPGFPWWAPIIGGALIVLVGFVWATGRPRREAVEETATDEG
ncbi:class C sortase [Microbacterium sp. MYb64]|uniref:class C sortase n=1 Tax=Microbacterium sp. MYb64 TaxID=1848691 RepID=UPI0021572B53|nr:class C sortase [Microbacterium sp. MYb64]